MVELGHHLGVTQVRAPVYDPDVVTPRIFCFTPIDVFPECPIHRILRETTRIKVEIPQPFGISMNSIVATRSLSSSHDSVLVMS